MMPQIAQTAPPAASAQDADDRQIIAKVSRHLLWFLFLLFVTSFLDRINIGFAGLTMVKDLGLTSTHRQHRFGAQPARVTGSFSTGLVYASVLLVISCLIMLILPIPRAPKTTA